MNIDRLTPENIRHHDDPFDEVFAELNDFARAVGGKSWEKNRSRRTGFQRSLSVYFDDFSQIETIEAALNADEMAEAEDIVISFVAERDLYDNEYFYTSYDIEYVHELPVSFGDIPEQYQNEFHQQMVDYNTDNDTQIELMERESVSEIHTHRYSVLEEDDSIQYSEEVTYSWMNAIDVNGESFYSVNDRSVVHGKDVDGFAHELGRYDDQVESNDSGDPETIIYDHKFAELTDGNDEIDTLFHGNDDHARRIMSLLSLLGSDLVDY